MRSRAAAGALMCLLLAGCGSSGESDTVRTPFTLPVGPTQWDASAPSWYADGVLHVGDRSVELGRRVDQFVIGPTGAYWIRGGRLMFTTVGGRTQSVAEVGWANLAVSADHGVVATVDQSQGPTDAYGTHVMQVAAFDTWAGLQLYRTPDRAPDDGADLTVLYGELMPMLLGVSEQQVFFDGATIDLVDGSSEAADSDGDGVDAYPGYADTLFPDGYRVGIRGQGGHRELADSSMYAIGRLSPDRSTIFDVSQWPTDAVAYDAVTGKQRAIDAPWDHFSLGGWSDEDTFFGVAEDIDYDAADVLRARQVVTCELASLQCTPVSPVIPTRVATRGDGPAFLMEGSTERL